MKKIFLTLSLVFVIGLSFGNNDTKQIELTNIDNITTQHVVNYASEDVCTITVNIYQDGVLVSSATWTDNTGDCDIALAGARMMAYMMMM
jgi:hypothetical protein